jgi:hypothetical protein
MENIKSKYNNYTFARGKLGDFLMNVDLAKRLFEVDGSMTKVITFRNYEYFKQIESGCEYIKVYKINPLILLKSLYDYLFNGFYFIYVAQLHLHDIPEKSLKYSILAYVYLAKLFSGNKFYADTFEDDFPFIDKMNLLSYEKTGHIEMQYECNIDLVKMITGIEIVHKPILDFKKSENYKKFLNNKKYIIFSLFAGERFKALDPNVWKNLFKKLMKYKNDFNFVSIGSESDKKYLDEIFRNENFEILRLEGLLSFEDTCNLISNSSGIIVGRSGNATLATMLHMNIPVLVLLAFRDRKWDYDYYDNLIIVRNDKVCKCVEGDSSKCIKYYEDTWRTMCIGELSVEDIFEAIKSNILQS